MNMEDFSINFGLLVKEIRNLKGMSLQALSLSSGIVSDQIQKIESAKHGGVQLETFAKLSPIEHEVSKTTKTSSSSTLFD